MSKSKMVTLAVTGCFGIFVLIFVVGLISTGNMEARYRILEVAKQASNTTEFDNMWKKIKSIAEVPEKKKEALRDIFVSHANARGSIKGALMTWVQESVPNADMSIYDNMMNIVAGTRDSWTQRQNELIDIDRKRREMFVVFPSNMFLAILGRDENAVTMQIVTSTKTEEVFKTGKDDDVSVFN